MPQLTQEQYQVLKSRGWDDNKINTVAQSQGYDLPQPQESIGQKIAGGLEKTGEFLGVGALSKGIAGATFQYTPEGKRALEQLGKGEITKEQYESIVSPIQPTGKQIAGSAIQTAATIGTAGLGKVATVLKAAGKFGGLTGLSAIGKGLEEKKTIPEALTGAIPAALTGAVLGAGFHYAGKLLSKATKEAPLAIYKTAIKQTPTDVKKELSKHAPILSKQLLEKGIRGSENKILTDSTIALNTAEKTIKNLANTAEGLKTIKTSSIAKSLNKTAEIYRNVLGEEGTTAIREVQRNILKKGETISIKNALKFKRDIYDVLSKSAFNADASLNQKSEALRTAANSLMNEIGRISPKIGKLTKDQQMWIRTIQAIEGQLSRQGKNLFGINDVIMASGGIADPTALTATLGRRLLETARIKTTTAIGLDRFGKMIEKLPTDTAGKISKTAIINLLKQINQ